MPVQLNGKLPSPEEVAQALDEREERLAAQKKRKEDRDRLRAEIRHAILRGNAERLLAG